MNKLGWNLSGSWCAKETLSIARDTKIIFDWLYVLGERKLYSREIRWSSHVLHETVGSTTTRSEERFSLLVIKSYMGRLGRQIATT